MANKIRTFKEGKGDVNLSNEHEIESRDQELEKSTHAYLSDTLVGFNDDTLVLNTTQNGESKIFDCNTNKKFLDFSDDEITENTVTMSFSTNENMQRNSKDQPIKSPRESTDGQFVPIMPILKKNRISEKFNTDDQSCQTLKTMLSNTNTSADCALSTAPKVGMVRCHITRVSTITKSKYVLYLETSNENIPILFSLTSVLKTSIYAIKTTNIKEFNKDTDLDNKNLRVLVAKFNSNLMKTEYTLKIVGNPDEIDKNNSPRSNDFGLSSLKIVNKNRKTLTVSKPVRLNIFIINNLSYKNNGFLGSTDLLKDTVSENDLSNLKFINKKPVFRKETNKYHLDFKGRIKITSQKNFQIVNDKDIETVVYQMGKLAENNYICDYSYPFNACQAFAIALSLLI